MASRLVALPPVVTILKAGKTIRHFPDDRWLRMLHAIADEADPAVRQAFLDGVRDFVSEVDFRAIEAAIEARNVDAVMERMQWYRFNENLLKLDEHIAAVLDKAGKATAAALEPLTGELVEFGVGNARSVEWIHQYGAQRIVQVGQDTRAVVRSIVARNIDLGKPADAAARQILQHIGLTERQSVALGNYRTQLTLNGVADELVEHRTNTYRDRLLRERSITIARTETMDAAAAGQHLAWKEGVSNGAIYEDDFEREWVAVIPSDGRTCVRCAAMDGKRAPINGTYANGLIGPTLHPRCRCAERLVMKTTTKRAVIRTLRTKTAVV